MRYYAYKYHCCTFADAPQCQDEKQLLKISLTDLILVVAGKFPDPSAPFWYKNSICVVCLALRANWLAVKRKRCTIVQFSYSLTYTNKYTYDMLGN